MAITLRGDEKALQGAALKPGADYYTSLEAKIPAADTVARFGKLEVRFRVESGKVAECRGLGENQEIWLVDDGREVGLNVPDTMLRARKGHFVSWMRVASQQPFPEFLVAAINYSTRKLTLADWETRFLAAATLVGAKKAAEALQRAGKLAVGRSFGIAFLVLFLVISFIDSRTVQTTIFIGVLVLALIEPYIQKVAIEARTRALRDFIATQYGHDGPVPQ